MQLNRSVADAALNEDNLLAVLIVEKVFIGTPLHLQGCFLCAWQRFSLMGESPYHAVMAEMNS